MTARHRDALTFFAVAVLYALVATHRIDLPGLYMDAVNPDHLAVRVLNPQHGELVEWVLPGNFLLGRRLSLLPALYHGSHTLWFGLPFYALLGTTIVGLRLTHALFALAVLGALFFCLRRAHVPSLAAGATCAVLALDPAFSFAFRTQSYITLFGLTWVLLSMAITLRASETGRGWWRAGFFAGFAASAYFIHAFFLLAFAPAIVLLSRRHPRPWAVRVQWALGVPLGLLPYIIGYARIMQRMGGWSGFVRFYDEQSTRLGVFSSSASLAERVAHGWAMLQAVVTDAWHHAMMFGAAEGVPGSGLKLALLVGLPVALWAMAEARRRASAALRLAVALPVAFFVGALVFGERLWGHHYIVLVPLLYAALALGLRDAVPMLMHQRTARRVLAGLAVVGLALNASGQAAETKELDRTGGVGLMSDAIDRFADDLNAMARKPFLFFPDWGLALPVQFLTRGNVDIDTDPRYDRARGLLCRGRDVGVGLIEDREAKRATWSRELAADPEMVPYRQRDGRVVFEIITFRADAPHAACADGNRTGSNGVGATGPT